MSRTEIAHRRDETQQQTELLSDKTLTITRIAHSCTLLDFGGCTFLADPWFSPPEQERIDPTSLLPNIMLDIGFTCEHPKIVTATHRLNIVRHFALD